MMRMRYFTMALLVLATLMLFVFVACGDADKPADTDITPTTVKTAATTTTLPSVGWITADSLRVRGGAGLSFEVIGGITGGERVQITGKTGDWYAIRFGDTIGYVSAQYVGFTDPATTTAATTAVTTVATTAATTA